MKTTQATVYGTGLYYARPQHGAALIIGLMLLLVLTLLGVAAIRGTTSGERMSANHQQHIQTFQATEAAVHGVMAELRGEVSPPDDIAESMLVTAINNGINPDSAKLAKTQREVSVGLGMTSKAQTAYTGTANLAGFSMSAESGALVAHQFTIDASGKQAGTNATSHQQQGIARVGPKP